jgi:N4-gp56 family major capsid protein
MATSLMWKENSAGGYFASDYLSKQLRYAAMGLCKLRQFVTIEKAFGKGRGDSVDFNKVSRLETQGAKLSEDTPVPETKFTISRDTLTLAEYGLKIPFTRKLEELSEFNLDDPTQRTLRDDMKDVIDAAVLAELRETQVVYTPLTASTSNVAYNGSTAASVGADVNVWHMDEIKELMEQVLKVPPYDGESYIAVGSASAVRALQADSDAKGWIEASKYGKPEQLFTGEMGTLNGIRYVKSSENMARFILPEGSTYKGEFIVFGADAVLEAVALPEEIRLEKATDLGRSKAIGWYGILGFKLIWKPTGGTETDNVGRTRVIRIAGS